MAAPPNNQNAAKPPAERREASLYIRLTGAERKEVMRWLAGRALSKTLLAEVLRIVRR